MLERNWMTCKATQTVLKEATSASTREIEHVARHGGLRRRGGGVPPPVERGNPVFRPEQHPSLVALAQRERCRACLGEIPPDGIPNSGVPGGDLQRQRVEPAGG